MKDFFLPNDINIIKMLSKFLTSMNKLVSQTENGADEYSYKGTIYNAELFVFYHSGKTTN